MQSSCLLSLILHELESPKDTGDWGEVDCANVLQELVEGALQIQNEKQTC